MIACQHLVQHNGSAKLVAAWIDNTAGLLRCHIPYCPTHSNCLPDLCSWFQGASNTKIGDNQSVIILVNEDILRFDITMDNGTWSCVCIVERIHQLMEVSDS